MKGLLVTCLAAGVFAGLLGFGLELGASWNPVSPGSEPTSAIGSLIVHEWGTFTSFSGSNGNPVLFHPNNQDLPEFVYFQEDQNFKSGRLAAGGTVSMETPVLYFYTDRTTNASVRVQFPRGWITEWYPRAANPPGANKQGQHPMGQSISWDLQLLPGESVRFPRGEKPNPYYEARATDAVPLQVDASAEGAGNPRLHGSSLIQREKFLFYRGVGTFPPPLTLSALGNGKVRIDNNSGEDINGIVLIISHQGKIGYQTVATLKGKTTKTATLPEKNSDRANLLAQIQGDLVKAGLFEKEAQAMIKTWESAWLGEDGTRMLYLVPQSRTDELLPLTIKPNPTQIVRVLVGRHDFLTPEQETLAENLIQRANTAQAELQTIEKEYQSLGRFNPEARNLAQTRLSNRRTSR